MFGLRNSGMTTNDGTQYTEDDAYTKAAYPWHTPRGAAKVYTTGAWAQANWGSHAIGISPSRLAEARKAAARSTGAAACHSETGLHAEVQSHLA